MKDRLKELVYIMSILVLLCTLIITIYSSSKAYKELLEINKSYTYIIEKQKEDYKELIREYSVN